MSDITDLLERFRRGAELVAVALTGAAGPEVDFAPEPKQWSIRKIMAHLADSEIVAAMRFRQIVAEGAPQIPAFDQEAWANNLDYARRKPSAALDTFRRTRGENYELLKNLPEEAYERTGVHAERGVITLRQLLEINAEHAESHAVQLRTRRAEFKQAKAAGR